MGGGVVAVGNIPYDVTDDKLRTMFERVGPVVSVKIMANRETGKSNGFGFVTYKDQATAESAVRNLNGQEINGRELRVGFATGRSAFAKGGAGGKSADSTEVEENVIASMMATWSPYELWELMYQLKGMIHQQPAQVRALLCQNPALAQALLHAQILLGMFQARPDVTTIMAGGGAVCTEWFGCALLCVH